MPSLHDPRQMLGFKFSHWLQWRWLSQIESCNSLILAFFHPVKPRLQVGHQFEHAQENNSHAQCIYFTCVWTLIEGHARHVRCWPKLEVPYLGKLHCSTVKDKGFIPIESLHMDAPHAQLVRWRFCSGSTSLTMGSLYRHKIVPLSTATVFFITGNCILSICATESSLWVGLCMHSSTLASSCSAVVCTDQNGDTQPSSSAGSFGSTVGSLTWTIMSSLPNLHSPNVMQLPVVLALAWSMILILCETMGICNCPAADSRVVVTPFGFMVTHTCCIPTPFWLAILRRILALVNSIMNSLLFRTPNLTWSISIASGRSLWSFHSLFKKEEIGTVYVTLASPWTSSTTSCGAIALIVATLHMCMTSAGETYKHMTVYIYIYSSFNSPVQF